MPQRAIVAHDLAEIFKVIAHPDRIRLIEELRGREMDVNSLAEELTLSSSRVSQHLSLLRVHRIVAERRDGRRHCYTLVQPQIADWIIDGLDFLEERSSTISRHHITDARRLWAAQEPAPSHSRASR